MYQGIICSNTNKTYLQLKNINMNSWKYENLFYLTSDKRRILKLNDARFISTEKVSGKDGNTTLVHYASDMKLTEF